MNDNGRILLSPEEEAIWRLRHVELGNDLNLVPLFRGWIPKGFDYSKTRILYVGKATSKRFDEDKPEEHCFNGGGAFWCFARQLSKAVKCDGKDIPCIAWSNISKLSCPQVKAEARLIAGFEEKAAKTLEVEIATTKPHIVVFVTSQFSSKVVNMIAHASDNSVWEKSENESCQRNERDIWWRRRSDGIAVLWMRHPMGAVMELRNFAAAKVAYLGFMYDPPI